MIVSEIYVMAVRATTLYRQQIHSHDVCGRTGGVRLYGC
jgi:hypothetical protein